jgi:hypothetical protein
LGFLLGAALLAVVGFQWAVLGMAGALLAIMLAVAVLMPAGLPRGRKGARFAEVFSNDRRINWLSAARMFLIGAHDVWFVVGIPVYFYSVLSDGSPQSSRTAFFLVGSFMALWTIGYGAVQASAPRLLGGVGPVAGTIELARLWVGVLMLIPATLSVLAYVQGSGPATWFTVALVVGLLAFGVVFALNSALHSYLILAFTSAERVTMDVGFYYMSNAGGRLFGTLLSGFSFEVGGLPLCLATAAAMAVASWLCARQLT